MNIHNLTIRIIKSPVMDLTPLIRYQPSDEEEEFYDTVAVPFNTPCIHPKKRVKYSTKNDLSPFDTVYEFLKFYSED